MNDNVDAASETSRPTSDHSRRNEEPGREQRDFGTSRGGPDVTGRGSSYEGVWSSGSSPSGSLRDPRVRQVGSTQIPPIAVNVTVNNYAGGPATTSRRMTTESLQQPLGGTTPLSETDISEDDVDGYSFVEIPETGD